MRLEEFKIGEIFWTGSGRWKCFDIGKHCVVATKWEKMDVPFMVCNPRSFRYKLCKLLGLSPYKRGMRTIDPEKDSWFFHQHVIMFDYDWDGCWATKEEYDEIMSNKNST